MLRGWKTESKGSPSHGKSGDAAAMTRASNGLEQFFSAILGESNLRILDMAGATQANVSYITDLGHRIYSDDILRMLDTAFGRDADFLQNQSDPARVEQFLSQSLDFPPAHFDGALVWDTLQFMTPPLLELTLQRLRHILKSSAYLLAFFHSDEKASEVTVYSYRIIDTKNLSLVPREKRKPAQFFNNRSLEKLFQEYQSVKFFLTRDHLREVIVRR